MMTHRRAITFAVVEESGNCFWQRLAVARLKEIGKVDSTLPALDRFKGASHLQLPNIRFHGFCPSLQKKLFCRK